MKFKISRLFFGLVTLVLLFINSSCGFINRDDPKDHCSEEKNERFQLESKSIQGSNAKIRVVGEQEKRVDGMDGHTEDECRGLGFKDAEFAVTTGLKLTVFICNVQDDGNPTWTTLEIRSEIDDIPVSE
ncbi:MAG: hypothetical protein NT027_20535 [Proteobacteria bacterium]|nr:hypothetical protein [Pseudomonadota bacterium]